MRPVAVSSSPCCHSPLAAWVALKRHAALILTEKKGEGVDELIAEAVRRRELRHADTLILVADLDVRVITEDGELLRALRLDPSRDYQAQERA